MRIFLKFTPTRGPLKADCVLICVYYKGPNDNCVWIYHSPCAQKSLVSGKAGFNGFFSAFILVVFSSKSLKNFVLGSVLENKGKGIILSSLLIRIFIGGVYSCPSL